MTQNDGYRAVAYFVNWAIYGRKHRPQDIPVHNLTHILYAFANVRPETGEVYLSDTWADREIHFDGDKWNEPGNNLYGCLNQLYLLKQKNRALKVLLSIGGWTYSANFSSPASIEAGRKKFADSALEILMNYGFDGLDIDWEYPSSPTEAQNYVQLLKTCRETLDSYSHKFLEEHHFALTVAAPAGPINYKKMNIKGMDRYLDFWNLMAYDYAGSWSQTAAHQTNLYYSESNCAATPFSTDQAVSYYKDQGVASSKIVLGMPLYGRAFNNTEGPGRRFDDVGEGTWEKGVIDYKQLPLAGAKEEYDEYSHASYSYDPSIKRMVSYDTVRMAKKKAIWIKQQNLGGGMWWETSSDGSNEKSLIQTVIQEFGKLECSQNCLDFPKSLYDNIKNPQK